MEQISIQIQKYKRLKNLISDFFLLNITHSTQNRVIKFATIVTFSLNQHITHILLKDRHIRKIYIF